jgi:lipoprotein-releasing system ATP-binding protein
MTGGPVLQAVDVTRRLENEAIPVTLVNGISLDVGRSEFVAIMGPSGSGKSSLLYLLGLLDRPTKGKIVLDGIDTSGMDEEELAALRLEKLGFVFQFHYLLPEFTAAENVAIPMRRLGRLSDREIGARAGDLLDSFGLKDHMNKTPSQMSGGQRQRVAIARALANEPLILFADEPTGNLDTASGENVRAILRDLVDKRGKTVVAVTHDSHFATGAHRIVTLIDGQIAAPGAAAG